MPWHQLNKLKQESKQEISGTQITSTRIPLTDQPASVKPEHLTDILYSACSSHTSWSTSQLGKVSRVPERWFGLPALCHTLFLLSYWSKVLHLKEVEMDLSTLLYQKVVHGLNLGISPSGKELLFKSFSPQVLPSVQLFTTVDQETEMKRFWPQVSGSRLLTVLPHS